MQQNTYLGTQQWYKIKPEAIDKLLVLNSMKHIFFFRMVNFRLQYILKNGLIFVLIHDQRYSET